MDEEIAVNHCPIENGTLVVPHGPKRIVSPDCWGDYYDTCEKIKDVFIPDSVMEIGAKAFYGCKSLTSIQIPSSVKMIDRGAFNECDSLKSVTFGEGVTSIGSFAFSGCDNLHDVRLPRNVNCIGWYAFDCPVTVDEGNESFSSEDGVLFNKDKTILLSFPRVKGKRSYIIPEGVKIIATSAFSGCKGLRSVTMPDSVTTIENNAFCGSGLKSVAIGKGVIEIGPCVFLRVKDLLLSPWATT